MFFKIRSCVYTGRSMIYESSRLAGLLRSQDTQDWTHFFLEWQSDKEILGRMDILKILKELSFLANSWQALIVIPLASFNLLVCSNVTHQKLPTFRPGDFEQFCLGLLILFLEFWCESRGAGFWSHKNCTSIHTVDGRNPIKHLYSRMYKTM